jgi:hypothetical protein
METFPEIDPILQTLGCTVVACPGHPGGADRFGIQRLNVDISTGVIAIYLI